MVKLEEKNYVGCIVGGAIGDALGAPIEFMNLSNILNKYGISGVNDFVEFPDGKGQITDDTQMLLFTAEGLLRSLHRSHRNGLWGAYTVICFQSYLRWLHTQQDWFGENAINGRELNGWLIHEKFLYKRRAPGNTCLTSLRSAKSGTISKPINNSKGCGGIMRIAPVGLLFHDSPKQAFQIGAELAAMTHGHPSGYLSAGYLSALIAFLNNGIDLMQSIYQSNEILKSYPSYEETYTAIQKALDLHLVGQPDFYKLEKLGGGWVGEEALAISIYCALSFKDDFEKAINLSINHSGDTDSTGSITGNIIGLMLGEEMIPKRWINNLSNYDQIKQVASDLYTEVQGNGPDFYDEEWEFKYPGY